MKRWLSLALVVIMALGLAVPAFSETTDEAPYEFTIMCNFAGELTENQKLYVSNMEKKLNIKLKFLAPAASAYNEALQMMVVSQEYADLVLYNDQTDVGFMDAVRNGLYLPLNEYLKDCPNLMAYS